MEVLLGALIFMGGAIFGLFAASLACAAGKSDNYPTPPQKSGNVRVVKDEKGTDD